MCKYNVRRVLESVEVPAIAACDWDVHPMGGAFAWDTFDVAAPTGETVTCEIVCDRPGTIPVLMVTVDFGGTLRTASMRTREGREVLDLLWSRAEWVSYLKAVADMVAEDWEDYGAEWVADTGWELWVESVPNWSELDD